MVQRGPILRPEDDPIEDLDENTPEDQQPEIGTDEEMEELNAVEEEKDPIQMEIDEEDKPLE